MSRQREPNPWQIRLLAGALGCICSGFMALVTSITVVGLVFGLVGMPVGAVLGILYGPELVETEDPETAKLVARLATLLGTLSVALVFAVTQSRGASVPETLELGFVTTVGLGLLTVPFGYPMAMVVARIATRETRRLAPHAWILWIPSAFVIGLVAAGTLFLGSQIHADGNTAAVFGDRVGFQYAVDDASPEASRVLEARSYLNGELALDNVYWLGGCATGSDALLGSDWSLWVESDAEQQPFAEATSEPPHGQLLVTSRQFSAGPGEPVRLTITIDAAGRASWHRGIAQDAGC